MPDHVDPIRFFALIERKRGCPFWALLGQPRVNHLNVLVASSPASHSSLQEGYISDCRRILGMSKLFATLFGDLSFRTATLPWALPTQHPSPYSFPR